MGDLQTRPRLDQDGFQTAHSVLTSAEIEILRSALATNWKRLYLEVSPLSLFLGKLGDEIEKNAQLGGDMIAGSMIDVERKSFINPSREKVD